MSGNYRSISSLSLGTRTNSTVTAPSGITNGDILFFFLHTGSSSGFSATAPGGFAAVPGTWPMEMTEPADPWTSRLFVWYKVASGESGNYTATHGSGSTEGVMVCCSTAGTPPASPLTPDPSQTTGTTSGGTETVTGVTTSEDNSLLVFLCDLWDQAGPASAPTGTTPTYTERYDPGATGVLYVATGVLTPAGATGNETMNSANGNGKQFLGSLISVAGPAAAGGRTTKNTRSNPLGIEAGMGFQMCG